MAGRGPVAESGEYVGRPAFIDTHQPETSTAPAGGTMHLPAWPGRGRQGEVPGPFIDSPQDEHGVHHAMSTLGSHNAIMKLLPDAYCSHGLMGAVVEDLCDPDIFAAVVWDGCQLYVRQHLRSVSAAEHAGAELLNMLRAQIDDPAGMSPAMPRPPLPLQHVHANMSPHANARLHVAPGGVHTSSPGRCQRSEKQDWHAGISYDDGSGSMIHEAPSRHYDEYQENRKRVKLDAGSDGHYGDSRQFYRQEPGMHGSNRRLAV